MKVPKKYQVSLFTFLISERKNFVKQKLLALLLALALSLSFTTVFAAEETDSAPPSEVETLTEEPVTEPENNHISIVTGYMEFLRTLYWNNFSILVKYSLSTFTSLADTCDPNREGFCNCDPSQSCQNSAVTGNGDGEHTYHHTNVYNNLAQIDLPDGSHECIYGRYWDLSSSIADDVEENCTICPGCSALMAVGE